MLGLGLLVSWPIDLVESLLAGSLLPVTDVVDLGEFESGELDDEEFQKRSSLVVLRFSVS